MYFLKVKEDQINYKDISDLNYKYEKIVKELNDDIKNKRTPKLFKHIEDKNIIDKNKSKRKIKDYIDFLTILVIIEEIGGIDKIRKIYESFLNAVKKADLNDGNKYITYDCSLLIFFKSIYDLDTILFNNAKNNMMSLNTLFRYEDDNQAEIYYFLEKIYDYNINIENDFIY